MSDKIVNLDEKRYDPHINGEARCMQCGHEEKAVVAPAGTNWLKCPECGSHKAFFKYPCTAHEGQKQWECNCGCDVFFIVKHAVRCANCGSDQKPFDG